MVYLYTTEGAAVGWLKVGKNETTALTTLLLQGYWRWSLKFTNNLVDSPLIFLTRKKLLLI